MPKFPLRGCTPEPLASYLKSLAVLRLVSEQVDPTVRGLWRGDVFHLQSALGPDALVEFFLNRYSPTPIVGPWNGSSGFYEGDPTEGIDAIRKTDLARFAEYRSTVEAVLTWPELPPINQSVGKMVDQLRTEAGDKPGKANEAMRELVRDVRLAAARLLSTDEVTNATLEDLRQRTRLPKNATQADKNRVAATKGLLKAGRKVNTQVKKLYRAAGKIEMVAACRNRLGDRAIEWLDTVVLTERVGKLGFPPLLAGGGIEGHLEYANTFIRYIASLLLSPKQSVPAATLLRNALFAEPTGGLEVGKFGQYYPGRAGGFNQGAEIETKDFPINPWDFVLTMEGAIVWAGGVARRHAAQGHRSLAVPFTVRSKAVGYSSATESDAAASRAEVWAPLWERAVTYPEIRMVFAAGRADVGRRHASHSIEFAEAAASLGVDRGVSEFVRYSLVKRRGDSYVALPAGRFLVRERSETDLLRQLDPILARVDRFFRGFKKDVPARFTSARRAVDAAIYGVLVGGGAARLKQLVAAIGRLERLFAERDLAKKPKLVAPLSGLGPQWIVAADDGSIEIRMAAALASIGRTGKVGPLRANLSPVDPEKPHLWAKGKGQTAWIGHSLAARLASALERRMMDADRLDCRANPLWGAIPILAEDALALVDGDVDESLLEDLLFGLTWIDFRRVHQVRAILLERWRTPVTPRIIPRPWSLLKLLFLPSGIPRSDNSTVEVRAEPSTRRLLGAGRVGDACRVATRRLYAAGLAPVQASFPDDGDGARLAAALLVPTRNVRRLMRRVLHVSADKTEAQ